MDPNRNFKEKMADALGWIFLVALVIAAAKGIIQWTAEIID